MELTQSLHRNVQQEPDGPATVFGPRITSWSESALRISRLAAGLRHLGVEPGDRVAMLSLNSDRYHEYLYATWWAGAVVNPVNVRWSPAEIAYSLEDSATRILLVDDNFTGLLPRIKAEAPTLTTIVHCGEQPVPEGLQGYDELLDRGVVKDANRGDDDLAGIFYTGGTTGFPKGVMLSHRNMLVSALGFVATGCLTSGGRVLHAAPMFHLADLAMWVGRNVMGGSHVIVPSFTPDGVISAIADHAVTDALLVPTMIQMLVDSPAMADADLSSLVKLAYGGSPISEGVLKRLAEALPQVQLTQAYGMTELSPVATVLGPSDHRDPVLSRSAGRAVPTVMVKIVDPDGREVDRGAVGEIIVSGDNVMQGYWGKEAETATAVVDGWMHTGDGGRMDERGYVFVVDRIKDMIVTGGENVYSAEVESAVTTHPAVAACAVIGVPDSEWGERVHAVVVLQSGASLDIDELRRHTKEHMAGYKAPRSLEIVDALPLTGAGKVLKRELRKPYWEGSARGVS